MKNKIISQCPICNEKLIASELHCPHCQTKLQGEFHLSKFDYLNKDQQDFILIFLKNAGNIKGVEKDLNISYPTVKKTLNEIITALGFDEITILENQSMTREEILRKLKMKEITIEEAEKKLKEIEEK